MISFLPPPPLSLPPALLCVSPSIKALCNTFAIHGEGLDAIGAALYEGSDQLSLSENIACLVTRFTCSPSLLNHCCLPNCVAVFAGLTVLVRTIKPVQLGEQVFKTCSFISGFQ